MQADPSSIVDGSELSRAEAAIAAVASNGDKATAPFPGSSRSELADALPAAATLSAGSRASGPPLVITGSSTERPAMAQMRYRSVSLACAGLRVAGGIGNGCAFSATNLAAAPIPSAFATYP